MLGSVGFGDGRTKFFSCRAAPAPAAPMSSAACTTPGYYCVAGTTSATQYRTAIATVHRGRVLCVDGAGSTHHVAARMGPIACAVGSFRSTECPAGSYCPAGAQAPTSMSSPGAHRTAAALADPLPSCGRTRQ